MLVQLLVLILTILTHLYFTPQSAPPYSNQNPRRSAIYNAARAATPPNNAAAPIIPVCTAAPPVFVLVETIVSVCPALLVVVRVTGTPALLLKLLLKELTLEEREEAAEPVAVDASDEIEEAMEEDSEDSDEATLEPAEAMELEPDAAAEEAPEEADSTAEEAPVMAEPATDVSEETMPPWPWEVLALEEKEPRMCRGERHTITVEARARTTMFLSCILEIG